VGESVATYRQKRALPYECLSNVFSENVETGGDVLQRKFVCVLSRLGQKRVAQSVKSGIRINLNLITGKPFPETARFRFEYPRARASGRGREAG
jgi:hypothetical protein